MTKSEQARLWAWRVRVVREATASPRNVAKTCRHFGISRQAYYRWKRRFEPTSPTTCITLLTGGLLVRIQPEEPFF